MVPLNFTSQTKTSLPSPTQIWTWTWTRTRTQTQTRTLFTSKHLTVPISSLLDGLLNPTQDLLLLLLSLSTATHSSLAQQSLLRPSILTPLPSSNQVLHVPLICTPWASAISAALHRHLGVSLHTLTACSNPFSLSFLDTLAFARPGSNDFGRLARTFYGSVGVREGARNQATLLRIRKEGKIGEIDRVVTSVKLAFVTSVLRGLREEYMKEVSRLKGVTERMRKRGRWINRGRGGYGMKKGGVRVRAKRVREGVYMVEGVLVEGRLLREVGRVLEGRYGVGMEYEERGVKWGGLVTLSNLGTALMGGTNSSSAGGVLLEGGLGSFFNEIYGVECTFVSGEVVRLAESVVDREEFGWLPEMVEKLSELVRLADNIRAELVQNAIAHKLEGASLSIFYAFKIAEAGEEVAVGECLRVYSDEYREMVNEARYTIRRLEMGFSDGRVAGKS